VAQVSAAKKTLTQYKISVNTTFQELIHCWTLWTC